MVKPEDRHNPPVPLQRDKASGFKSLEVKAEAKTSNQSSSLNNLFPVILSDKTDNELGQLAAKLVKEWGDRALTLGELEDYIATAAEKTPTKDENILAIRRAIHSIKTEYEVITNNEEKLVTEAGGLHVIGTERHESRRVDNQLRGRAGRQGDFGSTSIFFSLWKIIY